MPYCASIVVSGGVNLLAVESLPAADVSTCSMVVVSGAEYMTFKESASMWPPLSVADAQTIAAGIILLFAVAWTYRLIGRFFKTPEESE